MLRSTTYCYSSKNLFLLPAFNKIMCCAQTADKFQIKADIPGVTKQDIKLNVDGDVLSLSVQKAEQKQVWHCDSCYHRLRVVPLNACSMRHALPAAAAAAAAGGGGGGGVQPVDLWADTATALHLPAALRLVCRKHRSDISHNE